MLTGKRCGGLLCRPGWFTARRHGPLARSDADMKRSRLAPGSAGLQQTLSLACSADLVRSAVFYRIPRTVGLIVAVLVATAQCSRPHPTNPTRAAAPVNSAEHAHPGSMDAQALALSYIARLRAALMVGDRIGFARLLSYPVRVNTRSNCVALLNSPDIFIKHFDEVTSGRVEQALVHFRPPQGVHWQGISLGAGSVWVSGEGGFAKVLAFTSDVWRFPLPCAGEPEQPMPPNLSGVWQVTSVASLRSAQLIHRSSLNWIGRRINLDVTNNVVRLELEAEAIQNCVIERSARWNPDVAGTVGAPRAGLSPNDGVFVDLACGLGQELHVERLDVIGDSALGIVRENECLLVLKRAQSDRLPLHVLNADEPCGATTDVCPGQYICTAWGDTSHALHEACKPLR